MAAPLYSYALHVAVEADQSLSLVKYLARNGVADMSVVKDWLIIAP